MVKEELVSAVEGKKKTSPGREAEKREGKELPRRDEPEDFQTLYEESLKTVEEGQILRGTVIDITPDHVTVDVGYKSEGQVPMQEFLKRDKKVDVKIGDEIDVLLERKESGEGLLILSKEKADKINVWKDISRSCREGEVIEGEIIGKVKGGLSVDIGRIQAFLPGSQIDIKPIRNLDAFIGQRLKFKVIKFNRKRSNIVLSRRVLLDEERKQLREETLKNVKEGDLVEGTVKNLTDYGAFVDLGGMDGLLHITDISWGRIGHPSEKPSIGDRIKVKVLHFDKEKKKVSLGLKQAMPDPWETVPQRYPVGSRLKGKVVNVTDYGVFVELEDGVEGLVHISELTWNKKMKHPSKVVHIGDMVEVMVLDCDPAKRRISLGMKQIEPNPWALIEEKYPVGTKVVGRVKTVTDFGIFIGFDEGVDGLVHVSEISWTKKIRHPGELYKKGQEGEEGIEGLVHVSEISREKVEKPSDVLKIGDTVSAVVLHMDPHDRRIGLSIKGLKEKAEKAEIEKYISGQGSTSHSLGKLIQEEMEKRGGGLPPKKEGD